MDKKNLIRSGIALVIGIAVIALGDAFLGPFAVRILNLSAIYIILALSLNLLVGFTGLFSLGQIGRAHV